MTSPRRPRAGAGNRPACTPPSFGAAAALLVLAGWTLGCGGGSTTDRPSAAPPAGSSPSSTAAPATQPASGATTAISETARTEARKIYELRCTPCHGAQGHGDGVASKGLTPPPRDLSSPEWQESVTDEHVEKIIQYGGTAVGKSAAMPPNPDLMSKPEVVSALRELVRSLGEGASPSPEG